MSAYGYDGSWPGVVLVVIAALVVWDWIKPFFKRGK